MRRTKKKKPSAMIRKRKKATKVRIPIPQPTSSTITNTTTTITPPPYNNNTSLGDGSHPTLLSRNQVYISRQDGPNYISYEPISKRSMDDHRRSPRYRAFVCGEENNKQRRQPLRCHPHTKDPCVDEITASQISKTIDCPSTKSAHRTDVYNHDKKKGGNHLASIVWVTYDELDRCMSSCPGRNGCSAAIEVFHKVYQQIESHDKLFTASKSSASGVYAELGFGTGMGNQNTSFNASRNASQHDGIHLPYLRNPILSTEMESGLSQALSMVCVYLKQHCLDLYQSVTLPEQDRESCPTNVVESLAVANGLVYPSSPIITTVTEDVPTIHSSQVALRLVGCPPNASEKYKERVQWGGSGLHVDTMDPISKGKGFVTIYVCFVDEHNRSHDEPSPPQQPLKHCDLLIFQNHHGGRAVKISTMKVGYVCMVFHHSSRHLHGSVFPPGGQPETLKPGVEGLKIVCYQRQHINKLIEQCFQRREVFFKYCQAHVDFINQQLNNHQYNIACCHYAVWIQIMQHVCKNLKQIPNSGPQQKQVIQLMKKITYKFKTMLPPFPWLEYYIPSNL